MTEGGAEPGPELPPLRRPTAPRRRRRRQRPWRTLGPPAIAVVVVVGGVVVLDAVFGNPGPTSFQRGLGPLPLPTPDSFATSAAPPTPTPSPAETESSAPADTGLPAVPEPVGAQAGGGQAPASAAAAAPAPVLPALLVLNNSRIGDLADRVAAEARAVGWPVGGVGSLRGRIRATTVYYDPGMADAARQLQARLPAIQRLLPRPDWLPGSAPLTLVVTRYWT
jgi:hypothetical protein